MERFVTSATLSKAIRYMRDFDCGTISAERGAYRGPQGAGSRQRAKHYREHVWYLLNELREKYSCTLTRGTWTEDGPTTSETSIFVVDTKRLGTLEHDLNELGQEYAQDMVVFIPAGSNGGELETTARDESYHDLEDYFNPKSNDPNKAWNTPREWGGSAYPNLGEAPIHLPGKTYGVSRKATTQFRGRPLGLGKTERDPGSPTGPDTYDEPDVNPHRSEPPY